MVKMVVQFAAELENIASVATEEGFRFLVKIKCTQCGEEHPSPVVVTKDEKVDMPGSRGTANVVVKCKLCKRDHSIDWISGPLEYTDDSDHFGPMATMEFRGVEPVGWALADGWKATSTGGKTFEGIDLSENEWCDYDDDAGESVGIYGARGEWTREK